jgi:hypothetical protein
MKIKITNNGLQIIKRETTSGSDYFFMIFDNTKDQDSDERVFFCFWNKIDKNNWNLLNDNFDKFSEIGIEYVSTEKKGKVKNSVTKIIDYKFSK